jgi:hypothetical protein
MEVESLAFPDSFARNPGSFPKFVRWTEVSVLICPLISLRRVLERPLAASGREKEQCRDPPGQ